MCGCFVIFIGAMFPRVALVLLELFTDFNDQAFDSFWVGFIGFLFLPYTTLAFVLMDNLIDPINGFGWFVVVLGFLADVSSYGGAAQSRRRVAT
ncbi:MAG: hypothetical protein ABWZ42_10725 [Ilumatobacteraceae bacterium]